MNLLRARSTLIACVCLFAGSPALSQTVRVLGDPGWVGQRIVMLKDMGEVHSPLDSAHIASAVGINLVTAVVRVEGHRLWVVSTGGGDSGWVDSADARRLPEAGPYFTALIERDRSNWDAYLRRAEAEHALNERQAATIDYSKAIDLHPSEAFLYLRRGRHYNTLRACGEALNDFEKAISLAPTSAPQGYNLAAELYSLVSGVYFRLSGLHASRPASRCCGNSARNRTRLNASHVPSDSRQCVREPRRSSRGDCGLEAGAGVA